MAKKVVGREMTSKVGLDSAEAIKSLKTLTAEVRANTSGWKAQETALKSAGEYQKAAAARVDGLAKSMEMQKSKIDELKSRQSGLNRDTKDGEEQYLKLSDQINKASRSYDSMGGQLDRSKSKLQYYNSGLADLQRGYKQTTALSKSYVERLEAEGKSAEANKAHLGGLKQAYSNMEAQYKAQTSELERIKTASGSTSDAYKRQQVRVNETATSMAKAKTSQNELVKSMEKEPHGFMSGVRSKLDSVDDKAKKTSHLFGTILGAHLVANGVTNALSSMTASFGELNSAVTGYDNKQRTMAATWTTLTSSNGKGKQMVGIGNELASAFNQNINVVDELNQSFYHVFDNAPRTKELTKSVLTLGDTLNLSDENVTRLGTNFTHMLSSGKMQLGDFNMINDQLPMYAGKMLEFEKKQQHNSKLTMSTLRNQMSAGKISAKDAEEVMNSLGGKYAKASENLMKTIPGMQRSIRTQMPALLDAVYKPIANMKSPLMGQFTKWIGDRDTKAGFKDVGNALAMQIKDISKAFTGKNFNVGNTLDKMLANLAKGIDTVGANIVAHKKEIKSFFGSMKTASKTSFNVLVQSLKDIEPILKIIGGFAEKHPKVFAGLASSAFVASKGISALKLAFSGLDLAKGLGGKLSRIVFKPKVDGAGGKRELTKFSSFVKRSGTKMGHWLKMATKVTTTKAKGVLNSMWTHTKSVSGKIGKGLKWTAKIAYKGASKAFSVLGAGIKTIGRAFLSLGRLLLLNPIGLVVTAVVALGVAFYEAYKHIKPFREWVNKTFKAVVNFGKGLLKWGSKAVKTVAHTVKNIRKTFDKFKTGFKKSWNKHWSNMGKSLKGAWKGSLKHTREFFSSVGKKWSGWKKSFKKSWSKHWNSTKSGLHNAWNGSLKHTKHFFSNMGTKWSGWKKSWSHSWNSHWNKMRSNLHSYWKKDLSHTKVFGHSMGSWLSTFKKSFKGGWSGLVTGVKNIFKGLWKDLKKFARNGMNDVIDLINGGINAVDSVIHTFGGKRKTIGDLSHVHFAEGTGMFSGSRNPITKPTMAMLNDGNDSPETGNKEAVFLPNGQSGIVQGRNTKAMLPAGTEVLNAGETAMLMAMQGVTKYAKGTGFFGDILSNVTSGISGVTSWVGKKVGSLEKFFKTATNIIAHPIKSLENLFSWSSKGIPGVMSSIGHGLFKGVEKQAKTWWSSLWSMVDLDGGSAGGNWRHNPGLSETNGFGASRSFGSHDGVDFSGPLGAAIRAVHGGKVTHVGRPLHGWPYSQLGDVITVASNDGYQEIYQEFGGMNNVKVGTGDVIKAGQRIATLGRLNGAGSGSHVHIGVSHGSLWDHGGSSTRGWYDVTKMHGKSDGSPKSSKQSGNIKGIKSQVGSGFFKFMAKLASMFGDNSSATGSSAKPTGDHMHWLKQAGIPTSQYSDYNYIISHESGWNPKATNGGSGAYGLPQSLPGSKMASAGSDWRSNPITQLKWMKSYVNSRYGGIGGAYRYWLNHHNYENGGIINTNQLIEVAEHNKPEMVLPLTNKSRANQLIAQASQVVNGNNGSQIASTNSESNEKLDKLISLMSAILGNMGSVQAVIAKSDVVNAVKSNSKTASQYSQMMGY